MTRSSLTEETPATPGWVDVRLREIFDPLGEEAIQPRNAYAECLGTVRGGVDVDAGHDRCRRTVLQEIAALGHATAALDRTLQALEAEISSGT